MRGPRDNPLAPFEGGILGDNPLPSFLGGSGVVFPDSELSQCEEIGPDASPRFLQKDHERSKSSRRAGKKRRPS